MIVFVFHWMLHVPVLLFCSLLGKYNQIHIKQNSKVVVLAVGPNMCELTSCLSQRGNGYKWIHSKCFAVLQRLSLKSFTWIQLMVSIDRLSGFMQVPTRWKHAEYLSSDIKAFSLSDAGTQSKHRRGVKPDSSFCEWPNFAVSLHHATSPSQAPSTPEASWCSVGKSNFQDVTNSNNHTEAYKKQTSRISCSNLVHEPFHPAQNRPYLKALLNKIRLWHSCKFCQVHWCGVTLL